MLALGISLPAPAETLLVETNVVTPKPDGRCSLVEAINNANGDRQVHADCAAGNGTDTIVLPSSSLQRIAQPVPSRANQGLPSITSPIVIEGNESLVSVDPVPVDIVFNVAAAGDLTLKDTTISGDVVSGSGTDTPRVNNSGVARLSNVQLLMANNRVSAITNAAAGKLHADGLYLDCPDCASGSGYLNEISGNGLVNHGVMVLTNSSVGNLYVSETSVYNGGTMTLTDTVVSSNRTYAFSSTSGIVNAGTLNAAGLTFSENSAYSGSFCGIWNKSGANLRLEDSLIEKSGDRTIYGCSSTQFFNQGTAYLERVKHTDFDLVNRGRLSLISSTVTDGVFSSNGNLLLKESTLSGNMGVFIREEATLSNTTITRTENSSYYRSYIFVDEAAIHLDGAISVVNSTIGDANLISYFGISQLAGVQFGGQITMSNSLLIASSTDGDVGFPVRVFRNEGVLTTRNNVIGDSSLTSSDAFVGFTPHPTDTVATSDGNLPTPLANIVDTALVSRRNVPNQLLPRLANNGGPTQTVALVAGSPALDTADGSICPPIDQRGVGRPQGPGCDIGAFEAQATDLAGSAQVLCPGDVNGDGTLDIVVVGPNGRTRIHGLDGRPVLEFSSSELLSITDAKSMPDVNGNDVSELLLLGLGTGGPLAEVYDGASGARLSQVTFDPGFSPFALELVDDLSGNAVPELAHLGSGSLQIELKDALSTMPLGTVSFSSYLQPVDFSGLRTRGGNGALALLGEHEDPAKSDKVEIRNLESGAVLNSIWTGKGYRVLDHTLLADQNGNGHPEVAVLRSRQGKTQYTVVIRDTATNEALATAYFDPNYPPIRLLSIPDVNGNGADEVIVFGERFNGGNQKAQVVDGRTGDIIKAVFFNRDANAEDIGTCPDFNGNGAEELVLLATPTARSDLLRAIVKDARTAERLGVVNLEHDR